MANLKSKEKYSYRVSYAYDVGDSFDPDMENVDEWVNSSPGTCPCIKTIHEYAHFNYSCSRRCAIERASRGGGNG